MIHVRVRLGAGLARFAGAPLLSLDLPDGATVDDLLAALGSAQPALAPALHSALPVVAGAHVEREQRLHAGDEVALLIPVAGGARPIGAYRGHHRDAPGRARPCSSTRSPTGCSAPTCRCSARSPTAATSSSTPRPGCWGPMITPSIRGGHEVCQPVAVEGARVGDAIAIRIRDIEVTSLATASGNDQAMEGRFNGDPYCAPVCPGCGTEWPETRVEGIGQTSIRCANCGADATPFTFTNGYTIAFDATHTVGVTVGRRGGRGVRARRGARSPRCPTTRARTRSCCSRRTTSSGVATRLRPFMGQLGTSPSTTIPDSHNAGDFGSFLVGAPHRFALTAGRAAPSTRPTATWTSTPSAPGAILVCPVKVDGGGVYLGDMHALQGDGEIAGHTCDVSGTVTLEVEVVKGLGIDGPVLFPVAEDLPYLARPLTDEERARALEVARRATASTSSRRRRRSPSSAPARTSTRRPTTASPARPSCSA